MIQTKKFRTNEKFLGDNPIRNSNVLDPQLKNQPKKLKNSKLNTQKQLLQSIKNIKQKQTYMSFISFEFFEVSNTVSEEQKFKQYLMSKLNNPIPVKIM